jgi:hypothetical protein
MNCVRNSNTKRCRKSNVKDSTSKSCSFSKQTKRCKNKKSKKATKNKKMKKSKGKSSIKNTNNLNMSSKYYQNVLKNMQKEIKKQPKLELLNREINQDAFMQTALEYYAPVIRMGKGEKSIAEQIMTDIQVVGNREDDDAKLEQDEAYWKMIFQIQSKYNL